MITPSFWDDNKNFRIFIKTGQFEFFTQIN
jgi:hypothetical protein